MLSISSLVFLKEKRSGEINEWVCDNGRKQRPYIIKENLAYPTSPTEAVLILSDIKTHHKGEMDTFYIPGVYLHSETDEEVIMVL